MKSSNNKLVDVVRNSKELVTLVLINLIILITFIYFYPAIFDWDGVSRLINHNRIYVSHSLPGLQSIIYLMYKLQLGLMGVRVALIIVSLCASIALYLFVNNQFGRRTAFICSLLFMTTPRLLAVAIVPYQEMLMFLFVFLGLYLFSSQHENLGGLCLGVSCLVRYEAWIFCLLFAAGKIYVQVRDRNNIMNFKKSFLKPLIILWGITVAVILRHASFKNIGEYGGFGTLLDVSSINVIHIAKILFLRMSHPIVVFIFAILGIVHIFLLRKKKQKRLWTMIAFFLLLILIPTAMRINKSPSSFRTTLIPTVLMVLFVSLGINFTYAVICATKNSWAKGISRILLIAVVLYILIVNLREANSYYKATYKYTSFDEYYAASKIIKENSNHRILLIEPPNHENFKVTSIYLNNAENVYIYPSLNYSATKLKEILEQNDITMLLTMERSEDNINEVLSDMTITSRMIKNGIEIMYLD